MTRATPFETLLVFAWIGVVSVGGGLAIVPEMNRELVGVHGWLSAREFADGYAIGQLAPGPNMLAVVFYGYVVAGAFGGLVAAVATIAPGSILAALAGRAWATLENKTFVVRLRRGLVPVGFGLMTAGVAILARDTLSSWPRVALAVLVAAAVGAKRAHPAVAVLLAGTAGVALAVLRAD